MLTCVWVCVCAPVNKIIQKGKMRVTKFWVELGQCLKRYDNVERVFMLRDMNEKVEDVEIEGMVS